MNETETEKIDKNIKKIEKWYEEKDITESRRKALENSMSDMLRIKRMNGDTKVSERDKK